MGVISETKTVTKYKPYTDTETVYKATDGKEFKTEADAEAYQALIDKSKAEKKILDAFKARIQYVEAFDLSRVFGDVGYELGDFCTSFVFTPDVERFENFDDVTLFGKLTNLDRNNFSPKSKQGEPFEIGRKYLVIEWNDYGSSDYPSASGYFGLLADYMDLLQNEIDKAEKYLT